jgi:hypothetical protein
LDVSVRDNTNELGAELSVLFKAVELAKFFAKKLKALKIFVVSSHT